MQNFYADTAGGSVPRVSQHSGIDPFMPDQIINQNPFFRSIRVLSMWTEYEANPSFSPDDPDAGPEFIPHDWVAYAPIGTEERTVIKDKVARLLKVLPLAQAGQNPTIHIANARAQFIDYFYKNYKQGRDLSDQGTPLAVWPGITQEMHQLLKLRGIHTVEQLSAIGDAVMERLGVPGIRVLRDNAQRFIQSSDQRAYAKAMEAQKNENEALRGQVDEMAQMMREMAAELAEMKASKKAKKEDA